MPLTNYTITSPNGGTWTIQSTNTASVGRYHDLSTLSEGSSNNLSKARPGVLCAAAPAATSVPNALQPAVTGSGLNLSVAPGAAVIERGTPVGTYMVTSTAFGTVTLGTADATNPRIDRIDAQVFDGALGDNGGTSLTRFVVTQGVASGTPALIAAPVNSIPLGQVLLPANTVTLTGGMFTDTRKSAGIRGAVRVLLPGDSLADVGFSACEERMRYHATYGWLRDFWDPVSSLWRGTQVLEITQPALSTPGIPSGNVAVMGSQVIADPGWPYHIVASCSQYSQQTSGVNPGLGIFSCGVQVDNNTVFGTNMICNGVSQNYATSTSIGQYAAAAESNSRVLVPTGYTGSHTAYFVATTAGANFSTSAGTSQKFHLKLVPALI